MQTHPFRAQRSRRRALFLAPLALVLGTSVLTSVATAAAGSEVTIDDTAKGAGVNQWTYTGAWQVSSGESNGKFKGGDTYTYDKGDTATLRFKGSSVALYVTARQWHGAALISIDNGPAVQVDEYSNADAFQKLVYRKVGLTDTNHVLTVTHSGLGHADNPEKVVGIAIDKTVVSSATAAPTGTRVVPGTYTPTKPVVAPPAQTTTRPATAAPAAYTPPTAVATPAGAMPAIRVAGNTIQRGNQPWWFTGMNSFVWSGDCGNDDEKMSPADVDKWFASMRHDGHGAVRLFFYKGWDAAALDNAVAASKKYNIYVTVTLDDAIGGCGENDKTGAWFSDATERADYKAHLTQLVTKYKGDTTIAWFEYFNEPGGDGTSDQLAAFYTEMGAVSDAIDPTRLWASGTVAPYWLDGDANFAKVSSSPGVDIVSMHEYDENEVASNHLDGVIANSAGKPIIVGEYGIKAGSGCVSYADRAGRITAKLGAYTKAPVIGGFYWSWQPGGDNSCDLSNIDVDTAGQAAIRTFGA